MEAVLTPAVVTEGSQVDARQVVEVPVETRLRLDPEVIHTGPTTTVLVGSPLRPLVAPLRAPHQPPTTRVFLWGAVGGSTSGITEEERDELGTVDVWCGPEEDEDRGDVVSRPLQGLGSVPRA